MNVLFRSTLLSFLVVAISFPVPGQSRMEEKIGESTYHSVQQSMGLYNNPSLLEYVEGIGKKLESVLTDTPYDFTYYLVDTDEPNAFATAGGYVFVTRGLLAIIDTEDELAGVLGHEFTHVLMKHSVKKVYRNLVPAVLEMPGNLLNLVFPDVVGNLVNLPIELTARTTDAAFSRGQENDADRYGIELAVKAGYDPEGLRSALLKLESYVEERYNIEEHFTLFLDHPLTRDRVEHLDRVQESHQWEHRQPTLILHQTDGLIIGQNPEQGLITGDHAFIHPGLDIRMQFPGDWNLENTPASLHARDKSGQTGFVLGMDEKTGSILSTVEEMAKEVDRDQYTVETGMPYPLNGILAADLVITGRDIARQGKTLVTWLDLGMQGAYLQCMGTAHSEEEFGKLEKVIASIRPLTPEEKDQINFHLLYVDEGGDETLAEFADRKGPEVAEHLEWMVLLNRMEPLDRVRGKQIKYVKSVPYFSE